MRKGKLLVLFAGALAVLGLGGALLVARAGDNGPATPALAGPQTQSAEILESYLDPRRDAWQKPEQVLDVLGLTPGGIVGDIGAGSGYFTRRLAARVGPEGKVYAVDKDPAAVDFLRRRLEQDEALRKASNVEVVLSRDDDVLLPPGILDWAFLCDVHFFVEPVDLTVTAIPCLQSLHRALKPNGRVAVIESRQDSRRGKVTVERIRQPFEAAGFELEEVHDFLPRQHFVIFRKR